MFSLSTLLFPSFSVQNALALASWETDYSSNGGLSQVLSAYSNYGLSQTLLMNYNSFQQGASNISNGISVTQVAGSGASTILSVLGSLSNIASQAAYNTNSSATLSSLQTQYSSLMSEINTIANTTSFNNIGLLNSSGTLAIAAGGGSYIDISTANLTTGSLGLNIANTDVASTADAQNAITQINSAIAQTVNSISTFGANETQLQTAFVSDQGIAANLSLAATSVQSRAFGAALISAFNSAISNNAANLLLTQAAGISLNNIMYLLS